MLYWWNWHIKYIKDSVGMIQLFNNSFYTFKGTQGEIQPLEGDFIFDARIPLTPPENIPEFIE